MPELPEVETYARALEPLLKGLGLEGVDALWSKVLAEPTIPDKFQQVITGKQVTKVWRRAKYLVFELSDGPASLIIHLRMTGKIELAKSGNERPKHTTLALRLDDGQELLFVDYRKFGRVWAVSDYNAVLDHLGPEPLDDSFTTQQFISLLEGRRGRLKPLLLDQRFLAGLGNIYVDESLFRARLHPLQTADTVSEEEARALYRSIRAVLREAITMKGTTFQSFVGPEGQSGLYRQKLRVFGRQGEVCWRKGCMGIVEKIKVAQRGTHLCPVCQQAL